MPPKRGRSARGARVDPVPEPSRDVELSQEEQDAEQIPEEHVAQQQEQQMDLGQIMSEVRDTLQVLVSSAGENGRGRRDRGRRKRRRDDEDGLSDTEESGNESDVY